VTAQREGHLDGDADIADRISGRAREKSPEQKAAAGKQTAKPKPPPPTTGPDIENDPLIGL
jgi:hypothetical protein